MSDDKNKPADTSPRECEQCGEPMNGTGLCESCWLETKAERSEFEAMQDWWD